MLKEIKIANFKAFGDEQTIPIKPITLIYGANSSGKSSLIHSLLLCDQAYKSGNWDVHESTCCGDNVSLGGFSHYVHKRNVETIVNIGFNFEIQHTSWEKASRNIESLPKTIQYVCRVGTVSSLVKESKELFQKTEYDIYFPQLLEATLFTGYEFLYHIVPAVLDFGDRISLRLSGPLETDMVYEDPLRIKPNSFLNLILSEFNEKNQYVAKLCKVFFKNGDRNISRGCIKKAQWRRIKETFKQTGFSNESRAKNFISLKGLDEWEININPKTKSADKSSTYYKFFKGLNAYIKELDKLLQNEFECLFDDQLVYLGPIRAIPSRFSSGSYWDYTKPISSGNSTLSAIKSSSRLRDKINAWLGDADKLGTPYRLQLLNHYIVMDEDRNGRMSRRSIHDNKNRYDKTQCPDALELSEHRGLSL